jgi:Uma2 family endonuclease
LRVAGAAHMHIRHQSAPPVFSAVLPGYDDSGDQSMTSTLLQKKVSAPARPARVVIEGLLEIPPVTTLAEFREWALSDEFPKSGRIDYICGRIEVDTMTEEALSHGSPKSEIARVILNRVRGLRLGHVFIDTMRVSSEPADLSAEPDVVVVTHDALSSGRVELVKGKSPDSKRYMELAGAPDLVVEVLSDSSVKKDTEQLFTQYYAAGINEYWLIDARGDDVLFQIHHRGAAGFEPAPSNKDGYQHSNVLDARYRFEREPDRNDTWFYTLHQAE